jgi:hypothetical protein
MLPLSRIGSVDPEGQEWIMVCVSPQVEADATRSLASKEILFKPGDPKTHLYRVESGVI